MVSQSPTVGTPLVASNTNPRPSRVLGGSRPGVPRPASSISYQTPAMATRPIATLRRDSFSLNQDARHQLGPSATAPRFQTSSDNGSFQAPGPGSAPAPAPAAAPTKAGPSGPGSTTFSAYPFNTVDIGAGQTLSVKATPNTVFHEYQLLKMYDKTK